MDVCLTAWGITPNLLHGNELCTQTHPNWTLAKHKYSIRNSISSFSRSIRAPQTLPVRLSWANFLYCLPSKRGHSHTGQLISTQPTQDPHQLTKGQVVHTINKKKEQYICDWSNELSNSQKLTIYQSLGREYRLVPCWKGNRVPK